MVLVDPESATITRIALCKTMKSNREEAVSITMRSSYFHRDSGQPARKLKKYHDRALPRGLIDRGPKSNIRFVARVSRVGEREGREPQQVIGRSWVPRLSNTPGIVPGVLCDFDVREILNIRLDTLFHLVLTPTQSGCYSD